jgi:putative SOS response-associated peptidase YedK
VLAGDERVHAERFRWGLVPAWSREPRTRYTTVTARLDRAARSRIFGKPWRARHCIVPMTGYYKLDRTGKPHTPHFIQARDGAILLAAGLWEKWDREAALCSFAILTHPNPAIPEPLTPDGPVFVSAGVARAWLEGPHFIAGALLKRTKSPPLASHVVSKRYLQRDLDDYTLLEPSSAADFVLGHEAVEGEDCDDE